MTTQAAPEAEAPVLSEPQRLGVKLFLQDQEMFDRDRMIELFHRWIQEDRLPGTLIDVHDYTHVPGGPGVLLVAHEWHLRTDEAGGRIGLEYELKREGTGTVAERLRGAVLSLLEAGAALEQDTSENNPVRLGVGEMIFRFSDRLAVPATDAAFDEITNELENLFSDIYGDTQFEFERVGHERGPLTIHAKGLGDGDWTVEGLVSGARPSAG